MSSGEKITNGQAYAEWLMGRTREMLRDPGEGVGPWYGWLTTSEDERAEVGLRLQELGVEDFEQVEVTLNEIIEDAYLVALQNVEDMGGIIEPIGPMFQLLFGAFVGHQLRGYLQGLLTELPNGIPFGEEQRADAMEDVMQSLAQIDVFEYPLTGLDDEVDYTGEEIPNPFGEEE